MIWLVACAAVSALAACSEDDGAKDPMMAGLPNQPGSGGSAGSGAAPITPAPAGTGGSATETVTPPPRATGNGAVGGNARDAGAIDEDELADGGTPPGADAAVNPPPVNPPVTPPPAGDPVGFSDVFQLLVDSCGGCHGANAPGNRPRFAQAGNEAASFTATQAMSNGGLVSARIVARAVTARNMPPACGGAMLGTGACLDAAEAAQLQAWVSQGAQP
ncbi:MAG: hypothetical protein ABI895_06960 [Deltaproteobacteria bacterium]